MILISDILKPHSMTYHFITAADHMYSTGGENSLRVAGVTFRFHRRILFPVLLHYVPATDAGGKRQVEGGAEQNPCSYTHLP